MALRRGILVSVLGDDRDALRMWERQSTAANTTSRAYERTAVVAKNTAAAEVAASLKADAAVKSRIANLRAFAAAQPSGSAESVRATALADAATLKLARSQGEAVVQSRRFSSATRSSEQELSKFLRGSLSGSGILSRFGRSLAFASSSFLGFAIGASVVADSIRSAEDLEKADRALGVAIRHTQGDVAALEPQYRKTARAAAQFGVSEVEALTALSRATVLTGNAAAAQRAYQEALVISKATGRDFNAVLVATSKAQEGITTSLRRYGVLVDANSTGTEQFTAVMRRFGGQAAANTTESERLHAALSNTAAVIGQALLPTFDRVASSFANWLQKMQESGRLEHDVNEIARDTVAVFRVVEKVVVGVDKVTGSFANTLKILVSLQVAKLVTGWASSLDVLAAKWAGVTAQATAAGIAEQRALGVGVAGGTAGATEGALAGVGAGAGFAALAKRIRRGLPFLGGTDSAAVARIKSYTTAIDETGAAAVVSTGRVAALASGLGALGTLSLAPIVIPIELHAINRERNFTSQHFGRAGRSIFDAIGITALGGLTGPDLIRDLFGGGGSLPPPRLVRPSRFFPSLPFNRPSLFGASPQRQFTQGFDLTANEQLAQAQAQLTRTTRDDVAAARQVVARIKRLIDQGRLHGAALRQALGLEATALTTIWSAEETAAQQRAQRAQAEQARIQAQFESQLDPLRLEVDLLRAQAAGTSIVPTLRKLLAAARRALTSAGGNLTRQQQALQQIVSLQQQIKDATTQATVTFNAPAQLQLALARDQALGIDQTKDLLKLRKALLHFIATHKKNTQALIDAYNQLAQVNQQLGSSATGLLGGFVQASTRALTAGLGLTPDERKRLRARLSQLGPGGTVPGDGVGAAGFIIGPDGRPRGIRAGRTTGRAPAPESRFNALLKRLDRLADRPIRVVVDLDGRVIADNTTRHQERRQRRRSSQRRGPNAGR